MHYFKHSELVEKYHVSLKTVHNWIDAAKNGKVDLKLYKHNGRTYIANITDNVRTIENLANKGKKYRNSLHHKVISPKPEFYDIFDRRKILDIIRSINIHREILDEFNYFDEGAEDWDKWVKSLEDETAPNYLGGTRTLLRDNFTTIDKLSESYTRVNVIDIGAGNGFPIRELLEHLVGQGRLNKYIAIDVSQDMLNIVERNIHEWFGGKVKFEGYVRNVTYERFDDVLVDDMLDEEGDHTFNLVLLLGGTPMNFRSPKAAFETIYGSMGPDDMLIYVVKPDTDASRRYFDFNQPDSGGFEKTPIIELLNIDASLYDVEMGFEEKKRMRYVRIRFKTALTIEFTLESGKHPVKFEKGETLLLLRIWHQSPLEIISEFEQVGFLLLHSDLTVDRQFLMTISGIDVETKTHKLSI